MKNSIKLFLLLTIVAFSNLFSECAPEPINQQNYILDFYPKGKWESSYIGINGVDVTQQYKMTLHFDDLGQCVQTLVHGGTTLSDTLPYANSTDGTTITIGSANFFIGRADFEHIILTYFNGAQPAGFIDDWSAHFFRIE